MTFAMTHLSRRHDRDAARQPAFAPVNVALRPAESLDRHGLEFALQADRNTSWPTHRIRGFLLSQAKTKLP